MLKSRKWSEQQATTLWINLISDSCSCKQENPNNLDFLHPKKVWLKGMQPLCACSQRSLCPSSQVSILTTSPLIKNFKASGYLEFQKLPLSKARQRQRRNLSSLPSLHDYDVKLSKFHVLWRTWMSTSNYKRLRTQFVFITILSFHGTDSLNCSLLHVNIAACRKTKLRIKNDLI